jgi:trimeric autotransporter adhesin
VIAVGVGELVGPVGAAARDRGRHLRARIREIQRAVAVEVTARAGRRGCGTQYRPGEARSSLRSIGRASATRARIAGVLAGVARRVRRIGSGPERAGARASRARTAGAAESAATSHTSGAAGAGTGTGGTRTAGPALTPVAAWGAVAATSTASAGQRRLARDQPGVLDVGAERPTAARARAPGGTAGSAASSTAAASASRLRAAATAAATAAGARRAGLSGSSAGATPCRRSALQREDAVTSRGADLAVATGAARTAGLSGCTRRARCTRVRARL